MRGPQGVAFFLFLPFLAVPQVVSLGVWENLESSGAASYNFATARLSSSVGSSHSGNGMPPFVATGVGS